MTNRYKGIESIDGYLFEQKLNAAAQEGGKVIASSCGFANSEKYDFCSNYHAIIEFTGEAI